VESLEINCSSGNNLVSYLRCSPSARITFVKNIISNTLLLRETLSPFGAPSTDLVYPKSIVNNGSALFKKKKKKKHQPTEQL
jgi:hypothetical protein